MAAESDKVVVELIAQTDKFNADVRASSAGFQQSMAGIEKSASSAERAHKGFTASVGGARAGMLEFQHVVRGSVDQFAAGAPLTQIFAQHVASLGQAASLSGGLFGKFGAVLAGPWGIAATAAIAIATTLIAKHHEEGDSVEDLLGKLREHFEKTQNSSEADKLWADTIGGLIERTDKLTDSIEKRLQAEEDLVTLQNTQAQQSLRDAQSKADEANTRLQRLRRQLADEEANPGAVGTIAGAFVHGANPSADALRGQIKQAEKDYADAQTAITRANTAISASTVASAEEQARALASLSAASNSWSSNYITAIHNIWTKFQAEGRPAKPQDVSSVSTAYEQLKAAIDAAAGAGVGFKDQSQHANDLLRDFQNGKVQASSFAAQIGKITTALQAMTEAAKEANKHKIDPVAQFKQSVIGAEGTGQNPNSSAFGIGQFISSTFESYFKRLYPQQAASMSNAEIDKLRTKPQIAGAIIDAATDDYIKVLKAAGQSITAANLYTVHVLGEAGAKKLFAAPGGASARSVVGNNVANVNGNIFTGTVAQARAELAKRIGDSSSAISQGAVALVQLQQQEREREAQFVAAKDELEGQVIDARKGLAANAEQVWSFETAAVIAAKQHTDDLIAAQEVAGKLLPQEAEELKAINAERAKYRQQLVDQRLRQAQFAQAEEGYQRGRDFQTASFDAEREALQSAEGLATTAGERLQIEQRLIDLQFAEERLKNQYIIDWAERVKANQDATEKEKADAALAEQIAQMHQGTIDQRQANATYGNQQHNADPLQSYFNSIPDTADQINEALNGIAAEGLANFVDGIANAVAHFQSLGDVGRAVLQSITASLVKLALQEIIAHTVGRAASAASSAASVAQATAMGAAISAAMAGPAALTSLATSGANAIGAQAGIASTIGLATILGAPKAMGGRIFGPGGDTSDGILTPSSRDEYMIKASSARSIGYDMLDHMNRTGELPGFRGPTNGSAIGPGGSFGGISSGDIDRLVAAVEQSRSDVSVYAGLDPAEMLQRALGAPAGHRALLAHLGANSGAVNASLGRRS